jgi:putative glutamine amidotransferase
MVSCPEPRERTPKNVAMVPTTPMAVPAGNRPIVGITMDVSDVNGRQKLDVGLAYAQCVERAGGTALMLAPIVGAIAGQLATCSGFVFTGGDDPRLEAFGGTSHPKITPLHPLRQEYELALLAALESQPRKPVLGICLGMQLMCLRAGGTMDQFMPETTPTHARHWGADHVVTPTHASQSCIRLSAGTVHSKHKQAIIATGAMQAIATSDDGVIEAAAHPGRRFYVGVQWHPERTEDAAMGQAIFDQLIAACR